MSGTWNSVLGFRCRHLTYWCAVSFPKYILRDGIFSPNATPSCHEYLDSGITVAQLLCVFCHLTVERARDN